MATTYLDTNVDDKTQDILVIDVKPHVRCCNWVKKILGYDDYKWRRKWRTLKWYLCFGFFIITLVVTVVLLKLPWEVSVKKDSRGKCPLYSHEVKNKDGNGTSCLKQLCFNRGEK